MDLIYIYRAFHLATAQYTFFSAPHETFSKIDILGYKANLSKCKKVEITAHILPDHTGIKLEFKSKKTHKKHSNTWRLNNTLLNNQWVIEEIRRGMQKLLESNENENTEPLRCRKGSVESL
jgi:hypothetical protein